MSGSATSEPSSRHARAVRHVRSWTQHCTHLKAMHTGTAQAFRGALQRACGVCAAYALEILYGMYGNDHSALVSEDRRLGGDVYKGAGVLMGFAEWGFARDDGGQRPPNESVSEQRASSGLSGGGLSSSGSTSNSANRKVITAELEAEGTRQIFALGVSTFQKADACERGLVIGEGVESEGVWRQIRQLYYNAWEFLGVVDYMLEKREGILGRLGWGAGADGDQSEVAVMRERRRYAMWRATEIWKAMKEGRDVDVRGLGERDGSSGIGVGGEGLSRGMEQLGLGGGGPRRHNTPYSDYTQDKTNLRSSRAYVVGQDVWYSEVMRGCSRVKGTVTRVGWNDRDEAAEYDIVANDCGAKLDGTKGNTTCEVRHVKGECLAPYVEVGDCVVVCGEEFEGALVEEIYYSSWPPRYLCLVAGGLEEVEDDVIYFEEGEEEDALLTTESDSETCEEEGVCGNPAGGPGNDEAKPIVHKHPSLEKEEHAEEDSLEEGNAAPEQERDEQAARPVVHPPPPPAAPCASTATNAISSHHILKDDVVSMMKAEKMCKSALSCISFGDAPAAVRFLQDAIDTLTNAP